mmetsp:Transcript_103333/g.205375  ORF Transcript_103333/g.205375 Transcript_103333/m.205375 type:complete len:201 (-) Transcript_103333:1054-1656(-)
MNTMGPALYKQVLAELCQHSVGQVCWIAVDWNLLPLLRLLLLLLLLLLLHMDRTAVSVSGQIWLRNVRRQSSRFQVFAMLIVFIPGSHMQAGVLPCVLEVRCYVRCHIFRVDFTVIIVIQQIEKLIRLTGVHVKVFLKKIAHLRPIHPAAILLIQNEHCLAKMPETFTMKDAPNEIPILLYLLLLQLFVCGWLGKFKVGH